MPSLTINIITLYDNTVQKRQSEEPPPQRREGTALMSLLV